MPTSVDLVSGNEARSDQYRIELIHLSGSWGDGQSVSAEAEDERARRRPLPRVAVHVSGSDPDAGTLAGGTSEPVGQHGYARRDRAPCRSRCRKA